MARALGNAYTFESRGEIEIKGKGQQLKGDAKDAIKRGVDKV